MTDFDLNITEEWLSNFLTDHEKSTESPEAASPRAIQIQHRMESAINAGVDENPAVEHVSLQHEAGYTMWQSYDVMPVFGKGPLSRRTGIKSVPPVFTDALSCLYSHKMTERQLHDALVSAIRRAYSELSEQTPAATVVPRPESRL